MFAEVVIIVVIIIIIIVIITIIFKTHNFSLPNSVALLLYFLSRLLNYSYYDLPFLTVYFYF